MLPRSLLIALSLAACDGPVETDTADPGETGAVDTDTTDTDTTGDTDTDTTDTDTTDTDTTDTDTGPVDADADGFAAEEDCDDANPAVYPSAPEVCDGVDNDCDAATVGEGGVWAEQAGRWTDRTAELAAGLPDAPTSIAVEPGTLHVCDGTWYTHLSVSGTIRIVGHGTAGAPTLDGGGLGSVIAAETDGTDLTVEGLTLQNGEGVLGSLAASGGGIYCHGDGASSVTLVDSTVQDSNAYLGGAVYVEHCDLTVTRSTLRDNTASYGGAVEAYVHGVPVALSFTDSVVEGNVAASGGGGVNFEAYSAATFEMIDTFIDDNSARWGGGLWLGGAATEGSCLGTGTNTAGFRGNVLTDPYLGGAAVSVDLSMFDVANCDFGEAETTDDNAPDDVWVPGYGDPDLSYTYGDGSTFECDAEGCRSF